MSGFEFGCFRARISTDRLSFTHSLQADDEKLLQNIPWQLPITAFSIHLSESFNNFSFCDLRDGDHVLVGHDNAEEDDADDRADQDNEAGEQSLIGRMAVGVDHQVTVGVVSSRSQAHGRGTAMVLRTLANILPNDEQDAHWNVDQKQRIRTVHFDGNTHPFRHCVSNN